jgi:DNA-nicking Smr family endonuclease
LHGLTLIQAHDRLIHVLRRARDQKKRLLLVITGKGNNSQPHARTLKQSFEEWMLMPDFRGLVAHMCPSARHHGGAGAYYVLLKNH